MAARALILDDDRSKANMVGIWLEKCGVDSDKAYSFAEAEKRVAIKYAYLFLDYYLSDGRTGREFAILYQSKHNGCEIYHYSGQPEDVKDCTAIDILNLEEFLKDKFKTSTRNISDDKSQSDTKIFKPYDIYIIKQKLDDEINALKNAITRHDEKIINQEKTQEELKASVLGLNTVVTGFINEHSGDATKIVLWVAGILVTLLLSFMSIEWVMITHLLKPAVK